MKHNGNHKIPILSFFTGGGFLDIGFEQAGFEIVWTNEYDPLFSEMYVSGTNSMRRNNGDNRVAEISDSRSLIDIKSKEIIQSAFGNNPSKIFGIIGGPPCQDFSMKGKIKGFKGERGIMTKVFFDKISEILPSFFIMENVEGLWQVERNRKELLKILTKIKENYVVIRGNLNALEYGVPQDRRRMFLIGFSKDQFANVEFEVANKFVWPQKLYASARTAYSWPQRSKYQGRPKKADEIPLELCVASCLVAENSRQVANANEVFKTKSDKFHKMEEGDTRNQSFKRLHRYRFSPTACYGNNEVHLHPYLPRRLSVREALRIQGVPDSYKLPYKIGKKKNQIGLSSKFKMIGNGVPMPLAKHVAHAVMSFINIQIIKNNVTI